MVMRQPKRGREKCFKVDRQGQPSILADLQKADLGNEEEGPSTGGGRDAKTTMHPPHTYAGFVCGDSDTGRATLCITGSLAMRMTAVAAMLTKNSGLASEMLYTVISNLHAARIIIMHHDGESVTDR